MFDKRYDEALVAFTRAVALDPTPGHYFNLGVAQYQLDQCAAALASFDRVLDSNADQALKEKTRKMKERC
ncbi:MAG: tetratricopeptide repeat protein [Deltaproteobacteria bacterium]|nr:tetratricopeptide repeat protein [Kofleriaceae bacterium]